MELVKPAGILATGIIVAVAMHSYLSPYQSCVRTVEATKYTPAPSSGRTFQPRYYSPMQASRICARRLKGMPK